MTEAAAPATRTLACPACGGTITIRAAGSTVTLACIHCGSLVDVADPAARVIKRYKEAVAALEIPLGTRGTLKGVEWEAIGYLRRGDGWAEWDEYLLFNPYEGYRWLIGDGRGWNFGRMLTSAPKPVFGALVAEGERYTPFFAESEAKVQHVLGEFYWRVTVGEAVRAADWVRPGFMLSREVNAAEESWTIAELIDPREMRRAFGTAPPPSWPGSGRPPMPHQRSPLAGVIGPAWLCAIAAIVALFVLAPMFAGGGGAGVSETVTLFPEGTERSATIGPVTLTRARQPVTIHARSDEVRNQWVDLDYALVDRATQASFEAYDIVEEYEGSDSDGGWSEGSRSTTSKIGSVPAGTYDLVVDLGAHNWTGASSSYAAGIAPVRVTVSVRPGGVFWSNVWLAVLLILLPAGWLTWRHIRFETARTAESDTGGGT
ncbi:DUF4178 domain-containing protein [Sphingomonas profundi]|uniref:DUF4178 domain-containing protein n=1 Tax=Alterirhizorhabdus profundi TaxID=2681549 RepID=UPI0012E7A112|nr:DUF4178 domain-containing protein [Sphingomonas profundi]